MAFALQGPTLIETRQGETSGATFQILATNRPYRNVTLSVLGLPTGLAASFQPSSGKPTFESTLTLTASLSLTVGDYSITIRARDAKSIKTMPVVVRNYAVMLPDSTEIFVGFENATSSDLESNTPALIPVVLSRSSTSTITVNYAATGGTATGGGVDYTLNAGTLTFTPGQTSKNISITIINDPTSETDETIFITLSSPNGATLSTSGHIYTILNEDISFTADVWVAKTGSDSNDGLSEASPKLTIVGANGAASVASAGDRIAIKAGTYAESLGFWGASAIPSGSSFATATTLVNYPGDTVIIRGDGSHEPVNFYGTGWHHIILDGLVIDPNAVGSLSGAFVGNGAHHIRFIRAEVKNGRSTGGISLFDAAAGTSDCEILDSLIHNNGVSTQFDHGIYSAVPGTIVRGCQIYANAAVGFHQYNGGSAVTGGLVEKTIIRNNNAGMFLWDINSAQAFNNLVYDNTTGGISINNSDTFKTHNNTIAFNGTIGLDISANSTGGVARNNLFRSNTDDDINDLGGNTLSNNWLHADGDPLFVNAGTRDLHLTSSSGPRNAGTSTSPDVVDDFDDVTRPKGAAYDIGAYEFVE